MQGMRAFREKNVGRALEIFKELRKGGERSAELSYYLGSCYLNLGKHQSSIVFLNECLLQNERFSQNVYLYIAINFKLLGNLKQAIRILEKGTAIFPAFEEGFFYKAKLYMKVGECSEAMEAFARCLQINSCNDLGTRSITQQPSSWGTASELLESTTRPSRGTGRCCSGGGSTGNWQWAGQPTSFSRGGKSGSCSTI
jgi:tetratricopeptide (TPR) repeat protein